jgi:hypothetical protein
MVVKRRKTMVPCEGASVFWLDDTLVRRNRINGEVEEAANITELPVWGERVNSDYEALLKPLLYRPIAGYTWEELRPQEELNDLLATSAAQAEILELLSEPLYGGAENGDGKTVTQGTLAEKLVMQGLRAVGGFLQTPFHWWVALTCAVADGYFLGSMVKKIWVKCCTIRSRRRRRWSRPVVVMEPQPGDQPTPNPETPVLPPNPQMRRRLPTRRTGTVRRQYRPYSTPAQLTNDEMEARNRLMEMLRRADDGYDEADDTEALPVQEPPPVPPLPPPPPPPVEMRTFHVASTTPGPDVCIEMQEGSV